MRHGRPWLFIAAVALSVVACRPAPELQPARPEGLLQGLLAFLADGKTTRQEVLLQLGAPTAQFEGERILSYAFHVDNKGEWRRVERRSNSDGRANFLPGTSSLVLVFGPDGVLLQHSLVGAR